MTNKEAIGTLTKFYSLILTECSSFQLVNERSEALKTAISALQEQGLQQSCNDLATDTISRTAAIDAVHKAGITEYDETLAIEEIEKVSPTPSRPKGHWIINADGYYPYCSECKTEPKSGDMTDFCPSCGADMRGEQDG